MIKPTVPNIPGIPGMGAMTDTLDFVKNLWGGMGLPGMNVPGMSSIPGLSSIPGMVMPTLSVEEINKKITDLKAVESWLGLNMSMLRTTIQALEVQSATFSTLQSMGETFTATMTPAARPPEQRAPAAPSSSGATDNGSRSSEKLHGAPEPTSKDETDAASLTAPLVNAAAWWNMLQDQFKQAVNSAMTAEVPTALSPAPKPKAQSKAKAAPVASTSTARKRKTSK
jgi:hypothetical protein